MPFFDSSQPPPSTPIHSNCSCLFYCKGQYFLARAPSYPSTGIRGPSLGDDVEVTMEVAPGAYHYPFYLFWFLKGECTRRDSSGTTQMDNLIRADALLPCLFLHHSADLLQLRIDSCSHQPSFKPPYKTMKPSHGGDGAFGF